MKERVIGLIVFIIYRLYSWTFRYRYLYESKEQLDVAFEDINSKVPRPGQNFIYAFWHQDELSLIPCFANKGIVAMVSYSKDGTIMDTALRLMGYGTVRGSSKRKGVSGFLSAYKMVKKGYKFTSATDGPRGPIFKVKEGIIRMSEKSRRPIFPLRAFPHHYHCFEKAWNKAKLPMPFTKIDIVIGNSQIFSRKGLEEKLNDLSSLSEKSLPHHW
ncbi:MAG: DUF374 domain-containing protein [Deltaproteobacteria bacterium]|nr:DUF374 domain-containing protein [Deltaproteobacteria bacterium]